MVSIQEYRIKTDRQHLYAHLIILMNGMSMAECIKILDFIKKTKGVKDNG